MNVTEKDIRSSYEKMETHELEQLSQNDGLTEMARNIIDEVIVYKKKQDKENKVLENIFHEVIARLSSGEGAEKIRATLVGLGESPVSVDMAFSRLKKIQRDKRKQAVGNMFFGASLSGIGVLATIGSYMAVYDKGGRYFILWGLVLVGFFVFGRGLRQYIYLRR